MVTKRNLKDGDGDQDNGAKTEPTPPPRDTIEGAADRADEDRGAADLYAREGGPRRRRRLVGEADRQYDEVDGLITAVAVGGAAVAIEGELLPGILVGAGAMLLGRMFPELGGVVRPALKAVIRAGYAVTDSARGTISEATEQFRDVVAEVESERDTRRSRRYASEPRDRISDREPPEATEPVPGTP